MKIGVKGTFTVTVTREDGTIKEQLKFDNLITDKGMDSIAGPPAAGAVSPSTMWSALALSTNTAAPLVTDTGMGGTVVTTTVASSVYPTTTVTTGAPLWQHVWQQGFRFNAGTATGTWSSIGLVQGTVPFCRTLILSEGTPTSITVLPAESLDIRYDLTMSPDLSDTSGSVSINGTSYAWTGRCFGITDAQESTRLGFSIGVGSGTGRATGALFYGPSVALGAVNAGSPGSLTSPPHSGITQALIGSGGSRAPAITTWAAYTNGSFSRAITNSWAADIVNAANLVNALTFRPGGPSFGYQFVFSPAIPKTVSQQLSLTFTVTWARL